jgi:hypothetical protein
MTNFTIMLQPSRILRYLLQVFGLLLYFHISFAQSAGTTVSKPSIWDVTLLPPDSAVIVVITKCEPSFHPDREKEYPYRVNVVTLPVDSAADFSIDVYNKDGKEVARIPKRHFLKGEYHLRFDQLYLPDGVYLFLYKIGENQASGQLMVLRLKKLNFR